MSDPAPRSRAPADGADGGPARGERPPDRSDVSPATVVAAGPEAVHAQLSGRYGRLRISSGGGPHVLRLAESRLGPVRLDRLVFQMHFDADVEPPGAVHVGLLTSGAISFRSAVGPERALRPGDVFLPAPPDQPYTARVRDAAAHVAVFTTDLADQVAETAPGRAPEPVRFLDLRPVSAEAAAAWRRTFAYVRGEFLTIPEVAANPLLVGNAARLLVAATLSAFPTTALTEPTIEDRRDAGVWALRRAVAFIDDHAALDISVADIAAAARVSIRAVQLAFRRHLDTTPTAYLRWARLDHAHRELRDADPGTTTVGAVAAHWGFSSHSRFTGLYRAEFDVPPSRTLRA
ncbi:AraC family transcriptional regulator [Micromonospora sp. NPDC047707]|uniref:helix-turn-helix transcriptional regulator n=1 Tax=Micromonospora sp. NPDC047707 TaxID=3154498 RepID=UPI0034533692